MEITPDTDEKVDKSQNETTPEGTEAGSPKEEVKNPEAVLSELRRAQADLKALREENKKFKEAQEKAGTEENPFRSRAIDAEIKLALRDLGFKDTTRLMKFINREGIDFNEEGELVGLKEGIDKLKADLPELFDVKKRVGGKGDIFANDSVTKPKNSTEMQVARIFGRA